MAHGFSPQKITKQPPNIYKKTQKGILGSFLFFFCRGKTLGRFLYYLGGFCIYFGEKIFVFFRISVFSAFLNLSKLYDYVLN